MEMQAAEFSLSDLPGFGLAILLIVLFMVGYHYLARRGLWHRPGNPDSPDPELEATAQRPVQRKPASQAVLPVQRWLPLLFERAAHIVILGSSGSGKTRTARGLVRYIIEQRRERVVILDPKANRDTWMGLPALVRPADINQAMHAILNEFQRRLEQNPTLTEKEAEETFERIWIIVDEVSFVRDNCKVWPTFLRRISSMARSLQLHLIIVNQSERVEELGLRGLVSQTEYFNRSVAGEALENYYLIKRGEFAYNRSSSAGYPYGAIKQLEDHEAGILSTLYICFGLTDGAADATFYRHFFEAGGLNRGIYSIAQEGARSHGLLNVSLSDFFGLHVAYPPPEEQQHLGMFFDKVDEEIKIAALHLDKLQQQKRGLMQRLLTGQVRVRVDAEPQAAG